MRSAAITRSVCLLVDVSAGTPEVPSVVAERSSCTPMSRAGPQRIYAGRQYISIRFTEHLLKGISPPIWSVGDAYDYALI